LIKPARHHADVRRAVKAIGLPLAVVTVGWALAEAGIILAWVFVGGLWLVKHRDMSGSPIVARRRASRLGLAFGLVGLACAITVRLAA
jgi:hypothetical protein